MSSFRIENKKGSEFAAFFIFSLFCLLCGGERGIRTPGARKGSTVFKTAAFDHSAISPLQR